MMTRKDVMTVAEVIAAEKTFCQENGESTIPILSIAIGMRVAFDERIENFDSAAFMTACGWPREANRERPTT